MITYVKGKVMSLSQKNTIIQIGGIGYSININENLCSKLKKDSEAELFTYMALRENDVSLYGFATEKDLELFKLLISVKGVGPKSACEMLNSPCDQIKSAIAMQDDALLSKVPGIGKKTSQRIIIELQNKITDYDIDLTRKHQSITPELDDAIQALINLGYQKHQISKQLSALPKELIKAEDIIKYFLSSAK